MKIILENKLEKWAWEIMIYAYYEWEGNHEDNLLNRVDFYFEEVFKGKKMEMITKEVESRLKEAWQENYGASEQVFITNQLADIDNLTEEGKRELKKEFPEEYKVLLEEIAHERELLTKKVGDELKKFYYMFFSTPEKLTVIYNGEVIQQKS